MLQSTRTASALILTIGFVALVVSLGSMFLIDASAKYDESISLKLANYAEQASQTGFAHARRVILQDYTNNTHTSFQSGFRMAFNPLDTNGNPMDLSAAWEKKGTKSWNPPRYRAHKDPRINADEGDRVTYNMAQTYQNSYENTGNWSAAYGYDAIDGHTSRYYDVFFVDSYGNVVEELLADYVVRYTMEIGDENSKLSLNPDYPGHPIEFDYSDPDNPDYLSYLSYVQRFAKSMRSSISGIAEERIKSGFYKDNKTKKHYYLYEQPYESADPSGGGFSSNSHNNTEFVRYDRLFRGEGIQPQGGDWSSRKDTWVQTIPGKVFSYGQIQAHYQTLDFVDRLYRRYSPYTTGLRDQDWPAGERGVAPDITNIPNPNCPWRINLATVTPYTMQGMIFGMSSLLRSDRYGPNWSKGGENGPQDLFGPNYPEAFPLSLDSGKFVPLVGADYTDDGKLINGTRRLPRFPQTHISRSEYVIPKSCGNSYWWDIAAAMYKTAIVAKAVWSFELDTNKTGLWKTEMGYDPNSKFSTTPGDLSANPIQMFADFEEEFLRIMGEDVDVTVSGNSLAYNLKDGLLATPITGNTVTVGYGPQGQPDKFGGEVYAQEDMFQYFQGAVPKTYRDHTCMAERKARLRSGENTRGMEYLLNDFRMSLLGTPALNFDHDDADLDGTVELAPNSDDAESTVNGWWDYDAAGNRVRKWSWWYQGLPLTHEPANKWLEYPGWFRFYWSGSAVVERWNGEEWKALTGAQKTKFFDVNEAFLNSNFLSTNGEKPIKPWSATGRFYVGHSHVYQITCRGELFDIHLDERITQFTAEQILHVDPNRDRDLSDTVVLYQRTYGRNKVGGSTSN